MILSNEAARQVEALQIHYERLERPEATIKLRAALSEAIDGVESGRLQVLPAPRPYPELAHPGEAWVKAGRYWICYALKEPKQILAVFFETADIPRRR